jgi:putative N-acetyltransferase (TIGR04045 family)
MGEIICKIAETSDERAGHFAVRRAIFVEEQGMFTGTDVDEDDEYAIPIVAIVGETGAVIGAVRVYPAGGGIWYGGRLAVLPAYRRRAASIGANLCRLAEATVIAHGCHEFLAYIQIQNVRFFERLGWRAVGHPVLHYGQPHQTMAASLAAARQTCEESRLEFEQVTHA